VGILLGGGLTVKN